jgi:hypothetical protein
MRGVAARVTEEVAAAEGRLLAVRLRLQGASALHPQLAADPAHWRDEAEAVAQHAGDSIALERLLIETRAPSVSARGDSELDLAALLDDVLADSDFFAAAQAAMQAIEAKTPAGAPALHEDLRQILAEARDLALARAEQGA